MIFVYLEFAIYLISNILSEARKAIKNRRGDFCFDDDMFLTAKTRRKTVTPEGGQVKSAKKKWVVPMALPFN